jgi:hypothetical protein
MTEQIIFTPAKLAQLKCAYHNAVEMKVEQFTFEGHELLVAYAKFLIEYLENGSLDKVLNRKESK